MSVRDNQSGRFLSLVSGLGLVRRILPNDSGCRADDSTTAGNVLNHHGPGPDGDVGMYVNSRYDTATRSDQAAVLDLNRAGKMGARSDSNKVPDDAVVIDGRTGIDDHVLADDGVRLDHGSREDRGAFTQLHGLVNE